MNIPNLDNLIAAVQCEGWVQHQCEHCPYGYGYLDDSGDNAIWWCNEAKIMEDSLFFLQLYKHLTEVSNNDK